MILLVDDIKANLIALKALLESHDFEVDTASSGEEALRKILQNDYDLVILDVQMPEMDGYEVAEAINSLEQTRDIPVLFLSAAKIDKRFITKGYESGGVDYVTKPFDNDLLLLKIKSFLRTYEQKRNLKMIQEVLRREIDIRKKTKEELERSNLMLEQKVQERTEDLLETNRFLESKNAELTQYAYLASHDLQEPLRKIIMYSEIIAEKYLQDNTEGRELMQRVIDASGRMRKLIKDLLRYSNLNINHPEETTALSEVLQEVLANLEVNIMESKAQITFDNLPSIKASHVEMIQLFQNLISNAIKFSEKKNTPIIHIGCKVVQDSENPTESLIQLSFKDNGIGLNEKYQEKIFQIFQRLHEKSAYDGTGIGLAIVKKIVDKYKGKIKVESEEGVGTEFIITLPYVQP